MGPKLDLLVAAINHARMGRSITNTVSVEYTSRIEVDGAVFAPLVELWLKAHDPDNRRAKIQVALLEKDAVHCCGACGSAMSLANYRQTKTAYENKAALACHGCALTYVVECQHVA